MGGAIVSGICERCIAFGAASELSAHRGKGMGWFAPPLTLRTAGATRSARWGTQMQEQKEDQKVTPLKWRAAERIAR